LFVMWLVLHQEYRQPGVSSALTLQRTPRIGLFSPTTVRIFIPRLAASPHLRTSVPDALACVPESGPGLNAAVCHTTGLMPASSTHVPRCYEYS
jgi:hypothetical protein